jgi:hypothetical protein
MPFAPLSDLVRYLTRLERARYVLSSMYEAALSPFQLDVLREFADQVGDRPHNYGEGARKVLRRYAELLEEARRDAQMAAPRHNGYRVPDVSLSLTQVNWFSVSGDFVWIGMNADRQWGIGLRPDRETISRVHGGDELALHWLLGIPPRDELRTEATELNAVAGLLGGRQPVGRDEIGALAASANHKIVVNALIRKLRDPSSDQYDSARRFAALREALKPR